MAIFTDALIVGIILLCIIIGKRKGFIYTSIEVVGWLIVSFFAIYFSSVLSNWIYDSYIRDSIRSEINLTLSETYNEGVIEAIDTVLSGFPKFIINIFEQNDVTAQSVATVESSRAEIANTMADVIKPVICPLISTVISFIIFTVGIFLVRFSAKLCSRIIKRIPIVGALNSTLGIFVGFLKGVVISVIFVSIISNIVPLFDNGVFGITSETLASTYIFRFLTFLIYKII